MCSQHARMHAAAQHMMSKLPATSRAWLQDKQSVYMDRFLLLQQRLRRNRMFTAPVFGAGSHQQQQKHIEVRFHALTAVWGAEDWTKLGPCCCSEPACLWGS